MNKAKFMTDAQNVIRLYFIAKMETICANEEMNNNFAKKVLKNQKPKARNHRDKTSIPTKSASKQIEHSII